MKPIHTTPVKPSRRDFLRAAALAPFARLQTTPYDLVIKGGHVIDPSQSISATADVAIKGSVIAEVAEDIPSDSSTRTLDASGKIVTPGLIDVHVHVYPGVAGVGIWPDVACLTKGATTVLDGGSAGATTLEGFHRFVIARARTRVRALVNLSSLGLTSMRELSSFDDIDLDRARAAIEAHREVVRGIKVRMTPNIDGGRDAEALRLALALAEDVSVPLMVHIGGSPTPVGELLAALRPGDVVTHAFRARGSILDEQGGVYPRVLEARERGVFFDIGHGAGNFSFETAERALDEGFLPDTISSDLHSRNMNGPVFDLATTLSKFLHLGMSLEQCIACATKTPAEIFSFSRTLGSLAPGATADVALFELREGSFTLTDSGGDTRTAARKLVSIETIKDGVVV